MGGNYVESLHFLLSVSLTGGIVLGLIGYLSTLWGFATLLQIGVTLRIPVPSGMVVESIGRGAEAQRDSVGRQSAGLLLLALGIGMILTACALEGYVFALLVHLASA